MDNMIFLDKDHLDRIKKFGEEWNMTREATVRTLLSYGFNYLRDVRGGRPPGYKGEYQHVSSLSDKIRDLCERERIAQEQPEPEPEEEEDKTPDNSMQFPIGGKK